MKIKNRLLHVLRICMLLALCSCGRKTRNIYSFDEQETRKINKLSLPIVQGVMAKSTPQGNLISWFELDGSQDKNFIGYNVYHLVRMNVIPKHPCNKKPLKNTFFLDNKKSKKPACYLVRAVLTHNNAVVEGPISHIVCVQN